MKVQLPRGVKDFSVLELKKRNHIINTLKEIFILYGFEEIQTPAFETIDTLTQKYGNECEKLIFKLLKSGDFLKDIDKDYLLNTDYKILSKKIAKNALRYDLTVPFARYIIANQNDIQFPFKRYQIQPVWRADRPQKGRFREFYQCDIDIAGSSSLINEAEILTICYKALKKLQIGNFTIKINNRKILQSLEQYIFPNNNSYQLSTILDKYDKIGIDGIIKELHKINLEKVKIDFILQFINLEKVDNMQKLSLIRNMLPNNLLAKQGIEELEKTLTLLSYNDININNIEVDTKLARGLNYYTGLILEVISNDINIGSICGGGRYDNLTQSFSKNAITGIGLSFGIDRIYTILDELGKIPNEVLNNDNILILNLNASYINWYIRIQNELQKYNIAAILYPETSNISKQLNYANNKNIQYVIIPGQAEKENNLVSLKNMVTGVQQQIAIYDICKHIK